MPFPALSLPVSVAIGIPLGLAGFAVQEMALRRRRARRAEGMEAAAVAATAVSPEQDHDVTAEAAQGQQAPGQRPPAAARGNRAVPTPKPRKATAVTPSSPGAAAGMAAAAPLATAITAPARKNPTTRGRGTPAAALSAARRRATALNTGLDAIVTFVEAAPRRAAAKTCADALLLAVPRAYRGPAVAAYLVAAGAGEAPGKLQDLAEVAGMELATALRALKSEIRTMESA